MIPRYSLGAGFIPENPARDFTLSTYNRAFDQKPKTASYQLQLQPGDSWSSGRAYVMVVAVYKMGWNSSLIPPTVDTALLMEITPPKEAMKGVAGKMLKTSSGCGYLLKEVALERLQRQMEANLISAGRCPGWHPNFIMESA